MAFSMNRITQFFTSRNTEEGTEEGAGIYNEAGGRMGFKPGATGSSARVSPVTQTEAQPAAQPVPNGTMPQPVPQVQPQPVAQPEMSAAQQMQDWQQYQRPSQPAPGFGTQLKANVQPMGAMPYRRGMSGPQQQVQQQVQQSQPLPEKPPKRRGLTLQLPFLHKEKEEEQPGEVFQAPAPQKKLFHHPLPASRAQQYQPNAWEPKPGEYQQTMMPSESLPIPTPQARVHDPVQKQQTEQQPMQPQMQPQYQQPAQPQMQPQYQQPVQPQTQPQYQQPVQPQMQNQYQQPVQPQMQPQYQQPVQPQYQQPAESQMTWGNGRGERGYNFSQRLQRLDPRQRDGRPPRRSTRGQERDRMAQQAPVKDNVSYLNPNHFVDGGTAYVMVIRVAQPLSLSRCYRLIEFMRNEETVLVNMEMIPDPEEVNRCLDLLYGASFAMGLNFNRIANQCMYLISPRSVDVLSFAAMEGLAQRDAASRWPGSDPSNPQDPLLYRNGVQSGYQTGYQQYSYQQTGYASGDQMGYQTGYQTGYQQPGYQTGYQPEVQQMASGLQYERFY